MMIHATHSLCKEVGVFGIGGYSLADGRGRIEIGVDDDVEAQLVAQFIEPFGGRSRATGTYSVDILAFEGDEVLAHTAYLLRRVEGEGCAVGNAFEC